MGQISISGMVDEIDSFPWRKHGLTKTTEPGTDMGTIERSGRNPDFNLEIWLDINEYGMLCFSGEYYGDDLDETGVEEYVKAVIGTEITTMALQEVF